MSDTISRIRIKRIPTDQSLIKKGIINEYQGYGDFNSLFIKNIIAEKLGVEPTVVACICYKKDPFDSSSFESLSQYGFVDFKGINGPDENGIKEKLSLMNGETVSIVISKSETWEICIQNQNVNLMSNSENSETMYIFPFDHCLNPNSQNYNIEKNKEYFKNPFCAGEEKPIGYKNTYINWIFE
jgi:hypothetical protein